jgi:hypothetical protein
MGLALRLFPITRLDQGIFGYSHSVLELGGLTWDLGEEIRERARRLPDGHDITAYLAAVIPDGEAKGERYYGKLVDDSYGKPYCWLTAKELLPFLDEHWPKHPITAYVRALPSDNLIVLDWH